MGYDPPAKKVMEVPSLDQDPVFDSLRERIAPQQVGAVSLSGLWGSSAPMVAAALAERLCRPLLFVSAHIDDADGVRDDLEFFLRRPAELLPAWETLPGEGSAAGEIEAERLRVLQALPAATNGPPLVIAAPILALMQPLPSRDALDRHTISLRPGRAVGGEQAGPEAILAWAVDHGYDRLDLVESPGDVARRGDLVDLWVPGEPAPTRLEFFGDDLESIRRFDVSTQRSIATLDRFRATALPPGFWSGDVEMASLFDYLPHGAIVCLNEPAEVQELGDTLRRRMGEKARLFDVRDCLSRAHENIAISMQRFAGAESNCLAQEDFRAGSLTRFEGKAADVIDELVRVSESREVHVVCENQGEQDRLRELLDERDQATNGKVVIHRGTLQRGFDWTRTGTVVVGHHELFQRQRPRRRVRRFAAGGPLETWTDLTPGDYVVHALHGIALYRGLQRMDKGGSRQQEEFLTLEFADRAVVHVPCSQIELVQKYIGGGGGKPGLSKLGGKTWKKTKEAVEDAVSDLADSLLRLQAQRAAAEGIAYPEDTKWQREFEAAFPYDETEDQLLVAREIREDLTRSRPADRLICGDVGYGKTELAMRAAFKVVEYGRQVAVLVPTTVLAEQHFRSFRQRMAEYPFAVESLSRFRTASEQRRIIEELKRGRIDIVIGTHRLVSKDVGFANLGLVVIDEEQRFGVEHKERLKELRAEVDILTLTATPIPRTLHMSMMGLRDISSLQTPPVDRRAISTQVRLFDRELIRNAILRELARDGQVFFVHNFVRSIASMADEIRGIVPEARVVYGHGQMGAHELEEVMGKFVRKEADVLVSTTIIESGIDIPSANTIFIDRADRFGLADLHQLRGRVGRSDHRAYCYLLLSPKHSPTPKATKRLKTIEEFSDLGAGFRIAMRDLEIRGAGNLLGREQSGHIAAVGYEMYCKLLDGTVRRLKNEPARDDRTVNVHLDVVAHIPKHYITAERSRIEIYRRIATCSTIADLRQLETDLQDAFGKIPSQVSRLLELAEIRVLARRFGIVSITRKPPDVIFFVEKLPLVEKLFESAPGDVRMPDPSTIHLRLSKNYLEPGTLVPVLRRMFARATEGVEQHA